MKIDSENIKCSICGSRRMWFMPRESTDISLKFLCLDHKEMGDVVVRTINCPNPEDQPDDYAEYRKIVEKFRKIEGQYKKGSNFE